MNEADLQRQVNIMTAFNIRTFTEIHHREPVNNKEIDTWIAALIMKYKNEYKLQSKI